MGAPKELRKVVIVEPAAGNDFGGHMREKLLVFTQRLKEKNIGYHLFCWLPPIESYPDATVVGSFSCSRRLMSFVPQRFAVKCLEYLTYRTAFIYAAKHDLPVVGLTVSSPWGLVPARWGLKFTTPYVQRILYVGLHGVGEHMQIRKRVMWALQLALGKNGIAAFTTTFQNEMFEKHKPRRSSPVGQSRAIPEFILYDRKMPSSRERDVVLLIVGGDDLRRSPIQHLCDANLDRPFSKLLLHVPSSKQCDEKSIRALENGVALKVVWSNDYLVGTDLLERFGSAKYCLVAYSPEFTATSSISLQSIACGLPVLISDFPDGIHLGKTFGKIGEFFEYGKPETLKAAIDRLLHWTDADWNEFAESRDKIIDYCGYDRGVDYCLELMGLDREN